MVLVSASATTTQHLLMVLVSPSATPLPSTCSWCLCLVSATATQHLLYTALALTQHLLYTALARGTCVLLQQPLHSACSWCWCLFQRPLHSTCSWYLCLFQSATAVQLLIMVLVCFSDHYTALAHGTCICFSQQLYAPLVLVPVSASVSDRYAAVAHGTCVCFSDRYAEQVVPLLVQAQRKVEARIAEVGGPSVPQPHFVDVAAQLGHLVSARDYLTLQLKVHFDPARSKLIQPGAQIDPLGHNAYTGRFLVVVGLQECFLWDLLALIHPG